MKIIYRPEIDGLRAVAVIAVIIYHAKFSFGNGVLLPGGFLGVDIFFVISGFLITSIMVTELHKTGRISIYSFYERRARRILPALLFVMIVSIPFAWQLLLPYELIDYSQSLVLSLFFSSNFYWYYDLQQYGAESALLKPFLHTWSLAVEEQYYIIFPLILLAIYRWFNQYTIALLTVGFLLSLLFAEWMTPQDVSFSFYMLPSRFWELLIGGILAYIIHLHPQKDNDVLLNQIMPTLGMFLIVYSITCTELNASHPGLVTLIPVVGTVLIIWFANGKGLITRLLSSRGFTSIGLISYSLYLWHYPIFAFSRISWGQLSSVQKLSLIVFSLILAVISYYLVEKPFRTSSTLKRRGGLLLSLTLIMLPILAFSTASIVSDGFQNRYDDIFSVTSRIINKESQSAWLNQTFNHSNFDSDAFFSDQYENRVLILGDSHTAAWAYAISSTYKQPYNAFLALSYLGCYWEVVNDDIINIGPNAAKYDKRCNANKDLLNSDRVVKSLDTIVLASYRPFSYGVNLFRFDLLRLLKKKNPKINIIILGDYYQLPVDQVGCWGLMQRYKKDASVCLDHSDYPSPHYNYKRDKYFKKMVGLDYVFIDLIKNVCEDDPNKQCPYEFEGIPFMTDTNHLTPLFTRYITSLLLDKGVDLVK